jgi:hypothetical protein
VIAALALAAAVGCGPVWCLAVPPSPVCGDPIHVGVWAASPFVGPVTVRVRDRRGVWYRRTVRPGLRPREWYLPSGRGGRCRRTVVSYTTAAGATIRFPVRFTRESR